MLYGELGELTHHVPGTKRNFLHKRIFGAAKGFATGGIAGAVSGFTTSGRATRPTTQQTQGGPGVSGGSRTSLRVGPFGIPVGSIDRRFTIPAGSGRAAAEIAGVVLDRQARGPVLPTADGCPKGFHLNKSSYSLKDGTRIEERSLCVKNRRRNNDNGKAALRAARRLVGRKKHQETIDRALRAIAPSKRRSTPRKPAATGATIVSTAG